LRRAARVLEATSTVGRRLVGIGFRLPSFSSWRFPPSPARRANPDMGPDSSNVKGRVKAIVS
jgi:hypothetical protein